MRQRRFVWIAERAIDRIRHRAHFKPLQQSFVLRVEREDFPFFFQGQRNRGRRQNLDRVARLQIALADC